MMKVRHATTLLRGLSSVIAGGARRKRRRRLAIIAAGLAGLLRGRDDGGFAAPGLGAAA